MSRLPRAAVLAAFFASSLGLPSLLAMTERASAQSQSQDQARSDPCLDLDMASADAIRSCVETDPKITGRFPHKLRPGDACYESQRYIAGKALEAARAAGRTLDGRRLSQNDLKTWPRPSCLLVAEVVERLRGQTPPWVPCAGYSGDAAHMEACLIAHTAGRGRGSRAGAAGQLARMDCERLIRTYELALGRVYDFHVFPDGRGLRLPPGYQRPDCTGVAALQSAFTAELAEAEAAQKAEAETARQAAEDGRREAIRRREEQRQARHQQTQQQQAQQQRARQQAPRPSAGREAERDYDAGFATEEREIMARRRATPQPADSIDTTAIRHALVDELHRLYPGRGRQSVDTVAGPAVLRQTINGLRAATRAAGGAARVDVIRTILKVEDAACEIDEPARTATCEYRVIVGEQVAAEQGGDIARLLTGDNRLPLDFANRSARLKHGFRHDGTRWRARLSSAHSNVEIFLQGLDSEAGRFWLAFLDEGEGTVPPRLGDGKARTALIGSSRAPDSLAVYISLGCSHCLRDMEALLPTLRDAVELGRLQVELIEVSGLVPTRGGDDEADTAAVQNALYAGWIYDCAAEHRSQAALANLALFLDHLKGAVAGGEAVGNWRDWVYAAPGDLKQPVEGADARGAASGTAAGRALVAGYARKLELGDPRCVTNAWWPDVKAGMEARRQRFNREKLETTPKFLLNGREMGVRELLLRLKG